MKTVVLPGATWAKAVADAFAERVQQKPALRVCLASGNTPRPVFHEMAQRAQAGELQLQRAELILLDEYGGLDPNDPGRCANMLIRDLIEPAGLPRGELECINPDAPDLQKEIERLKRKLEPGLDLAILGVGLNGHIGMNEPGSSQDDPVRRVALHPASQQSSSGYGVRRVPTWGVTVGLRELLAAQEVWLLATGANKAEIIKRTIEGEITTDNPASYLNNHPDCTVFLDHAAASLLTASETK